MKKIISDIASNFAEDWANNPMMVISEFVGMVLSLIAVVYLAVDPNVIIHYALGIFSLGSLMLIYSTYMRKSYLTTFLTVWYFIIEFSGSIRGFLNS